MRFKKFFIVLVVWFLAFSVSSQQPNVVRENDPSGQVFYLVNRGFTPSQCKITYPNGFWVEFWIYPEHYSNAIPVGSDWVCRDY